MVMGRVRVKVCAIEGVSVMVTERVCNIVGFIRRIHVNNRLDLQGSLV